MEPSHGDFSAPTDNYPHLGTVEEENDFDFSKAIHDVDNPEIVSVPHKVSGQRMKLKKGFYGARIIDLESKVSDLRLADDN